MCRESCVVFVAQEWEAHWRKGVRSGHYWEALAAVLRRSLHRVIEEAVEVVRWSS